MGSLALGLFTSCNHTKVFLTPPSLPTTNSSLTTLHLAQAGSLLVSTFSSAGGELPPQVTRPLTVPQASSAVADAPNRRLSPAANVVAMMKERITCLRSWPP